MQPPYSQSSRENVTPSSRTSPLACYKEVPPTPRDPIPDQEVQNLYPFSDQKGAKTILFGAAHTYMAYIRECPPPPAPPATPEAHCPYSLSTEMQTTIHPLTLDNNIIFQDVFKFCISVREVFVEFQQP